MLIADCLRVVYLLGFRPRHVAFLWDRETEVITVYNPVKYVRGRFVPGTGIDVS